MMGVLDNLSIRYEQSRRMWAVSWVTHCPDFSVTGYGTNWYETVPEIIEFLNKNLGGFYEPNKSR